VFEQFWALGRHEDDDLQELRWASHAMDGALTKAPLDGGKTGPNPPDRGKRGTQRSLLVDGRGVVLDSAGAGAHRNDHLLLQATRASSPARCLLAPLAGGTDQPLAEPRPPYPGAVAEAGGERQRAGPSRRRLHRLPPSWPGGIGSRRARLY
jgi:hypothetical protein